MKKILFIIILIIFSFIFISHTVLAASSAVQVKGNIPSTGSIKIFGYTGAYDKIEAQAARVYAQTTADATGYFLLDQVALADNTQELCLTSIDSLDRTSFPTCIPVVPSINSIGPIVLPPTLSLNSPDQSANQAVIVTGQTIPTSVVKIVLSKQNSFLWAILPNPAYAFNLPEYGINPDQKGNFSFKLSSNSSGKYRIFALSHFSGNPTPKSQTLLLTIPSAWGWWLILIIPLVVLTIILRHRKNWVGRLHLFVEAISSHQHLH